VKAMNCLVSGALAGLLALAAGCTGEIGGDPGTLGQPGPSGSGSGSSGSGGPGTTGGTTGGATGTSSTTGGVTTTGGSSTTTGGPAACEQAALPTRIWRLNDKQYGAATADLLPGIATTQVSTPGRDSHEFISWEDLFPIQEAFTAQLSDAAQKTAQLAVKNLTNAGNTLVPCTTGQDPRACAQNFVTNFAGRAFRRPLEADETTRLMSVYDVGVTNGTGFADGIELVIEAVLQAPSFLYRTELGAGGTAGSKIALTPYEVASSISFLLSNSIPDAELWKAAQDGSIADQAVLTKQIDRLLTVPKVQDNLTWVVMSWVGGPKVLDIEKTANDRANKTLDDPARQSMYAESRQFTSDVLWNGGTIADLFQSKTAFVDKYMADFYGLAYTGTGVMKTTVPANRSGLLTRAGMVTAIRYGTNPEVFRGETLRTQVLCGEIPPPPPTVNVDAFNAMYGGLSTRERIAVRQGQPQCNGCHQFMDPLGIAYDNLGGIGQIVTTVNNVAANPSGQLSGTDVDGAFADLNELSAKLSTSGIAKECMAKKLTTYAVGHDLVPNGVACANRDVVALVEQSGNKASALFKGIALNPVFTTRVVGGP
jgi:hypothetical protein